MWKEKRITNNNTTEKKPYLAKGVKLYDLIEC